LGFHPSSGFGRRLPQHRVRPRDRSCPVLSLSWGSFSLQRTPAQRSGVSPRNSRPRHMRLQSSSSLDALLSITPPDFFESGRSWDSPFRAFFLSKIRRLFRVVEPSWRYSPRRPHASSAERRTLVSIARFMTPRELEGKPPSRPWSFREAVPVEPG